MRKKFNETSKTGAIAWLLQRISAIVLFVLLISHYIGYHFLAKGYSEQTHQISFDKVKSLMSSPLFNLIQFLFLITALYHGINGIWMVIEDYISSRGWRIFLYSLLMLVGISLLFVGTLTIMKVSSLGVK